MALAANFLMSLRRTMPDMFPVLGHSPPTPWDRSINETSMEESGGCLPAAGPRAVLVLNSGQTFLRPQPWWWCAADQDFLCFLLGFWMPTTNFIKATTMRTNTPVPHVWQRKAVVIRVIYKASPAAHAQLQESEYMSRSWTTSIILKFDFNPDHVDFNRGLSYVCSHELQKLSYSSHVTMPAGAELEHGSRRL